MEFTEPKELVPPNHSKQISITFVRQDQTDTKCNIAPKTEDDKNCILPYLPIINNEMILPEGNGSFKSLLYWWKTNLGNSLFHVKDVSEHIMQNVTDTENLKSLDNGGKTPHCKLCDYKCTRRDRFQIHIVLNHTGGKPFKCNLCSYSCTRKDRLKSHMLIHNGEKPLQWKLCDYKCIQKINLQIHMRVHSGEKPFECKICSYKCEQKKHLRRHMSIHSGEKPFE